MCTPHGLIRSSVSRLCGEAHAVGDAEVIVDSGATLPKALVVSYLLSVVYFTILL